MKTIKQSNNTTYATWLLQCASEQIKQQKQQ